MRGTSIVRAGSALALAVATGWASADRADWGTYQANAAHTGYVAGALDEAHWNVRWAAAAVARSGGFYGISVGGGGVYANLKYAASSPGNASLFALDQETGAPLWSKAYTNNNTTGAPAYANGTVYVQTDGHSAIGGNYLHAYNARSGVGVFDAPYDAQWETYLAPTPYAGNVYMGGGYYGGMYAFDGAAGTQKWVGTVGQYDGWTPAVDATYTYSFTGSGSTVPIIGQFRAFDRTTGTMKYEIDDKSFQWNGYTMNSAVVLGSHTDAFAINEAGSIYLDGGGGGRLIRFDLRSDTTHTPHISWAISDQFTGQVTLANDVLYANDGGSLRALDDQSGATLWTWPATAGVTLTGPMVATDNVLFASSSSTTYAIDLATHAQIWSYPEGGKLALSDYTLYIAGNDGSITAIAVPEPTLGGLATVIAGLMLRRRTRR